MKTRTTKQIEKGAQLIEALCMRFRPFVEAACKPKIEAEMAQTPQFSEEEIKNVTENVKQMPEDLPPDLQDQFRKLAEMMKDPQPATAEEIAKVVDEESANETLQLVRNWLNTYFYAEANPHGIRTVSAANIDDAMLPPLDFVLKHGFPDGQTGAELFAECCNSILDADETRAVLRQVRAALPPGQFMPAEAVEFLTFEGTLIILP